VVSPPLRAVTFNARHGVGVDGQLDLDRTAALLTRLAPDVAGLQELDDGAERSGRIDQAVWLGRALGMQVASGPARGRRPHERVALLSPHPLSGARTVWFWDGGRLGEPRAALLAEVNAPAGHLCCVVAHLSTRRWERAAERRSLARTVTGLPGPVLAFLDANGSRLGPLRRVAGLHPPPGRAPASFPAEQPRKPVDWVLARAPARHLSRASAPAGWASDHLPVLALVGC
jgi:endonuclease/exonuclease/phosphatase family metal-dependent hydrolase